MAPDTKLAFLSNLGRWGIKENEGDAEDALKHEITKAFSENRSFSFFPDKNVINHLRSGTSSQTLNSRFIEIKNDIVNTISDNNSTIKNRLLSNARLSSRIVNCISLVHQALAEINNTSLDARRFVAIKEKPGNPTIYHISDNSTVLLHVGQGPRWTEIPTIYMGLNIFDTLAYEQKKERSELYQTFKSLLLTEERAIETGYSHIELLPPDVSSALYRLIDEVIRISKLAEIEYIEIPERKKISRFTRRNRQTFLNKLDTRLPGNELGFDYDKNLGAIKSLECLARRYKKGDDLQSIREIVRLLVAASGHDIHEVRNRANVILERIFAPKEFDAPLAANFVTVRLGAPHHFDFELPVRKTGYFVRIYRSRSPVSFILESDIDFIDLNLHYDKNEKRFTASHLFDSPGYYDYLVFKKQKKGARWLINKGCSGRINIIPDVSGEVILEIFPDIHGHTRVYWKDNNHPGLVYNENGEVIRLGRFSDISAHLEDLKKRYRITALYLLGVQKRGSNREDWTPEATSPSPFSPMSLTEIEPSLGGEKEFKELVEKAHALDVKIIVDIVPHVNRKSTAVPANYAVKCYDDSGNLVVRASTDGRYGSWNDGKLLNYRKFEIWEFITGSILTLIDKYDIDGIRFDSAHAVPIMMKKNNYPYIYGKKRTNEEMVEGAIIVNDREDDHFITTGYYDSACRDIIACPFHYYLMLAIEKKLREKKKKFFVNIAECYWGRERVLARTGIIPYNSALFKICESIIHGKTDVREIYHLYDNYFLQALPPGTELLGVLGNHDEHRVLSTFGYLGLRAAVALTSFMSNIIMDYEGSAEGEGWKVYLDNIYVNWNQFESASHRGFERFYRELYTFHRENKGK